MRQSNSAAANDDGKRSEMNKMSLLLDFDRTFADIESEKEDNEAQITPSIGSTKEQLWQGNDTKVNWQGDDILSKRLIGARSAPLNLVHL